MAPRTPEASRGASRVRNLVEVRRNLELARREDELARNAHEQSEAAQRFALRQVDEGLREYFLRMAGRAEMDSLTHAARARRFEGIASTYRATPAAAERAMSQAKVELVKQVVAAVLRCDFDVALEHLPERTADWRSTARKQATIVP
jgi:hypothetical protein